MVPRPGLPGLNAANPEKLPQRLAADRTGIPLRALLGICAAVVLAHWLLLGALPRPMPSLKPPAAPAFTTRTVKVDPPRPEIAKPEPPKPPVKPTPPKPKPKPAPRPPAAAPPSAPGPAEAVGLPAGPPAEAAAPSAAASEAVASAPPPRDPVPEPSAPRPPREAAPNAAVLSIPGSARLRYDVSGEAKRLSYTAAAQLLWLRDGSNYEATLEVSAFLIGKRSQTSTGQLTAEGLAPTRYAEKWRNEVAAHLERDKGRIVFSANTPEAPLLAGAQDRLSVIMQLVGMFAGEPQKYPPATTLTLQVVGPRDAEIWLFTVEGEETVQLRDGPVQALRVTRNPRKEFDTKIEVWFAPMMSYLPVRVRATQANGDFIDQKLLEIEKP